MFIDTAITNQSKLRRSEIKASYTLRSYGANKALKIAGIYKHFIPTGLVRQRELAQKQEVRPLLYRGHTKNHRESRLLSQLG